MIIYDKAKYHYDGQFPNDLSSDQALVHTGMFLGWIIDKGLFSGEFEEDIEEEIKKFKSREVIGTKVYKDCDGVIANDMLEVEGNEFSQDYFDFEEGL